MPSPVRVLLRQLAPFLACACLTAAASTATEPTSAYLFAHFTGESPKGEQIYFSVSEDGQHWTDLNNSEPVLISTQGEQGVRDPSLIRSADGKKFIILATDLRMASGKGWDTAIAYGSTSLVFWESTDLVNWSAPWMADVAGAIPDAGCAWAPEAIYDNSTGDYFVCWATIAPRDGVRNARIYGARTKDFRTFTPPELYIARDGSDIVDTQIIEMKGAKHRYYRVSSDGRIILESADSLHGNWTLIGDLPLGSNGSKAGGPILFPYNQEPKWGLLVEQYTGTREYLPFVGSRLDDLNSFHVLPSSDYSFGVSSKLQGGIVGITRSEYASLLAKWPPQPVVQISPLSAPGRLVRHQSFQIRLEANVRLPEDSRWQIVPGLLDGTDHVTFRSVNFPDRNLVVTDAGLILAPPDGSDDYAARATFQRMPGLASQIGDSFRPIGFANHYLIEQGSVLGIGSADSETERRAATFTIRN